MKHIRSLDVEQPLDTILEERAVDREFLNEERGAGPKFFRGLIIAGGISLPFYATLFLLFF